MKIEDILNESYKLGIKINVVDNKLKIQSTRSKIPNYILEEIKAYKVELINYLNKGGKKSDHVEIKNVEKRDYYLLTSVQSPFYVFQKLEPNSTIFNVSGSISITKEMSNDNILIWVRKIIERHEAFRTAFIQKDNNVFQKIYDEVDIVVEKYEIKQNEVDTIFNKFKRPFDLSLAPILRVGHVFVDDNSEFIVYDTHHILSDKITQEILWRDFNTLSKNEVLLPLKLQYRDYSEWQNTEEQKTLLKKQEKYWSNVFNEGNINTNLPANFKRPKILNSDDYSVVGTVYNSIYVERIRNLIHNENISIFIFFYSVLNILLNKITGQNDFAIGSYILGRKNADLENIVGIFINTIVIRNNFDTNSTYKIFSEKTSKRIIEAFENSDYPFENLVDVLKVKRESNRNPIFDIALNYQEINSKLLEEWEKEYLIHEKASSKVDLDFQILDFGEKIVLRIVYCDKLFLPDTIDRFILYTNIIIETVLNNPNIKLSEIKIIDSRQMNIEPRSNVEFEL